VSQRLVDPGAWVSQNAPVVVVVDIASLRLVANVVEKDLKSVKSGDKAAVGVDAFPGENFNGRIARVSPILDPATRTAVIEVEIPNPAYRLKPGMYANVTLEIETRENILTVPKIALVDSGGSRGVYQPNADGRAEFKPVQVGLEVSEKAEVLEGLNDGDIVVSTGAGALRRNDQLVIAGGGDGPSRPRGAAGQGNGGGRRAPGEGPGGARPNMEGGQAPSGQEGQPPRRPQSSSRQLGQQSPVA
jgi:RND family efflux transporter MFP subunit